jgi:hypothetical protein
MNILPLVCGLLFVLVLGATTLIKDRMASEIEEKSFNGFMQAGREMQTKIARKLYAAATTPAKKKEAGKPKGKREAVFHSRRESPHPHNASCLNISKLLSKKPNDLLYQMAAKLIRILYGHANFFKEAETSIADLEYRLLDEMIDKGKSANTITDLCPDNPLLRTVFYKMLKGTNQYDLKAAKGYPPLADFISIEREKKPISFCFASRPVLEACFGDGLTLEILNTEKKKWEKDHIHHTVTQKELRELLMHHPKLQFQFDLFLDLLSFSNRSGKRSSTVGTDPTTGLNVVYRLD